MTKRIIFACLIFLTTALSLTAQPTANAMKLWYRQPAVKWEEALPIGNGRLGAMVFGGVQEERLQINEDTIWAGEKRDRNNPKGASSLPEVRRLLRAGKVREAEELADKNIISIEIEGRSQHFLAALDSRSVTIDSSVQLAAKKEDFTFNLVRIYNKDFLDTLREKLMWGLDNRN